MKKLLLLFVIVLYTPVIALAQANVGVPVCGTATDSSTKYIPSDWATFTPPAKGGSYVDTSGGVPFGCRITRLTNAGSDIGAGAYITLYYDTVIPFSADNKLIMVYPSSGSKYIIQNPYLTGQNGTAVPAGNMPSLSYSTPPMWDRTQPEMFYYTTGTQLRSGTVTGTPECFATNNCTVTTALVHDFTGTFSQVGMMDETSESVDGDHILMEGLDGSNFQHVFVWSLSGANINSNYTSTCTGSLPANNGCLHKMQIGGDNNPVILPSSSEFVWNGSTSICLQGSCGGGAYTSHGATGRDLSGNPVWLSIVGTDNLGSQTNPCGVYTNIAVVNTNSPLSPTNCLIYNQPQWHIGYDGSAAQPWVFITPFQEGAPFYYGNSGSYTAPIPGNWSIYNGEFVWMRIDTHYAGGVNAKVIRLAQTRNRSNGSNQGFWNSTYGALSMDGLYAVFTSNMAFGNVGCSGAGPDGGCADLYLVSNPAMSSFRTTGAPLFSGSGPPPSQVPNPPTNVTLTVM